MSKLWLKLVALLGLWSSLTAAENLIVNGKFIADQTDFPAFWDKYGESSGVHYQPSGGPGGTSYISLQSCGGKSSYVRQTGAYFCAGEKYRFSGYFRTRNAAKSRVGIINSCWQKELRIAPPPTTGRQWQFIEQELTMIANSGKFGTQYGIVIYLAPGDELLEVADLRLIALTPKAQVESRTILEGRQAELIPLGVLNQVPQEHAQLPCIWTGKITSQQPLQLSYQWGTPRHRRQVAITAKNITLNLGKLPVGTCPVTVAVTEQKSGKKVFAGTIPVTVVPDVAATPGRNLNNMVQEYAKRTLKSGEGVTFAQTFDGWIYVRSIAPGTVVALDGQTIITPATARSEAIRYLARGEHRVTMQAGKGAVIVRSIPEIFNFPGGYESYLPRALKFDWNFFRQYIYGAVTTISSYANRPIRVSRVITPAVQRELTAQGIKHIGNLNRRLGQKGIQGILASSDWQGVSVDEFTYHKPEIQAQYVQLLKKLTVPLDKVLYTWVFSVPTSANLDFIAATTNWSNRRLLCEAYLTTRPTLKATRDFLKFNATRYGAYKKMAPQLWPHVGIVLGNFCQNPSISLYIHPEVDYKYFLDLQMQLLATAPELSGLKLVGFWGTHIMDEETARWCFALARHYLINGCRELLSERYGFKFNGLLRNGDFERGFQHWQGQGRIETTRYAKLGKIQGRYGDSGETGDTCAVLYDQATLRQSLTGLTPGRRYKLRLSAVDYRALLAKQTGIRKLPLTVSIAGGQVVPELSFHYVDRKPIPAFRKKYSNTRTNFICLVFRAQQRAVTIEIKTQKAPSGSAIAVNNISVNPYFENVGFKKIDNFKDK